MTHAEFAKLVGLGRNRSHLTRVLSGKIGLSPAMDKRIRSALGLTIDRNGDAFRVGEKWNTKGGAK